MFKSIKQITTKIAFPRVINTNKNTSNFEMLVFSKKDDLYFSAKLDTKIDSTFWDTNIGYLENFREKCEDELKHTVNKLKSLSNMNKDLNPSKFLFSEMLGIDFEKDMLVEKNLFFTNSVWINIYFSNESPLVIFLENLKTQYLNKSYFEQIHINLIPIGSSKHLDKYFIQQIIDFLKFDALSYSISKNPESQKLKNSTVIFINLNDPDFDNYFLANLLVRAHFIEKGIYYKISSKDKWFLNKQNRNFNPSKTVDEWVIINT